MTPKEKANELVNMFRRHTYECVNTEAKKCALICVDEIQNSNPCVIEVINSNGKQGWVGNSGYWQEVKQEIEKL